MTQYGHQNVPGTHSPSTLSHSHGTFWLTPNRPVALFTVSVICLDATVHPTIGSSCVNPTQKPKYAIVLKPPPILLVSTTSLITQGMQKMDFQ